MDKKFWCVKTDCVKGAECARLQAFLQAGDECQVMQVVNPRFVGTGTGCPYYAAVQKVMMAKGFAGVFDRISRKTARDISMTLELQFGRNPFYKRRRGEQLIDPAEQAVIKTVFERYGCTETEIFDAYEEADVWVEGN